MPDEQCGSRRIGNASRPRLAILVGSVVGQCVYFAFFVAVARGGSVTSLGTFATAVAVINLAGVVAQLGARTLIIREHAAGRDRAVNLSRGLLSLKFVILVPAIFVACLCLRLVVNLDGLALGAVAGATGFYVLSDHLEAELIGRGLVRTFFLGNCLSTATIFIGLSLLLWRISVVEGLIFVFASYSIRLLAYLVLTSTPIRSEILRLTRPTRSGLVEAASTTAPFYLVSVLTIITAQVPVLLLAATSSVHQAGLFEPAGKAASAGILISATLAVACLPVLARISDNSWLLGREVRLLLARGSLIAVIAAAGISAAAPRALELLGTGYGQSTTPVRLMLWYLVLTWPLNVLGVALTAAGREKVLAVLGVFAATVFMLAAVIAAPHGAAALAGTFVGVSVVNLGYVALVVKRCVALEGVALPIVVPAALALLSLASYGVHGVDGSVMGVAGLIGIGCLIWSSRGTRPTGQASNG